MHRHIPASTSHSFCVAIADNFPENSTTSGLVEGLANGARCVWHPRCSLPCPPCNIFDQCWNTSYLKKRHRNANIVAAVDYLQSDSPTSQEGEPPKTHLARFKDPLLILKP
ncbi:hypothetical protein M405DRAFT_826855 [Rhizopogon salebrosus TDB-379]|nr:hypothetical protein M405DRAFT_826855 [Rhizopogon salebrosus TDB-379]